MTTFTPGNNVMDGFTGLNNNQSVNSSAKEDYITEHKLRRKRLKHTNKEVARQAIKDEKGKVLSHKFLNQKTVL